MSRSMTDDSIFSLLPPRNETAGKWDFGRAMLIAGSHGMAGAACLAAKAAYRTGCGLCEILTPESNRIICQTLVPEAVMSLYDAAIKEYDLKSRLQKADAVGIGPGIGFDQMSSSLPYLLLRWTLEGAAAPLVLDADALNVLAARPELWEKVPAGTVLTPHIREMARLTGFKAEEILPYRTEAAEDLAAKHNVILVLKGHGTVVTDGVKTLINPTGNAGMATGGAGDVLTGVITSLLAQGVPAFGAAALGVYLHGLAGDAAARKLGQRSLTAGDIVDGIPEVLRSY